jgi:hypothetical protein
MRRMAAGVVATLAAALAPGSFVAISHLTADFAPQAVSSGAAAYNALVPAQITARSHAEVTGLIGRLSLVAPGWSRSANGGPITPRCAPAAPTRRIRQPRQAMNAMAIAALKSWTLLPARLP